MVARISAAAKPPWPASPGRYGRDDEDEEDEESTCTREGEGLCFDFLSGSDASSGAPRVRPSLAVGDMP